MGQNHGIAPALEFTNCLDQIFCRKLDVHTDIHSLDSMRKSTHTDEVHACPGHLPKSAKSHIPRRLCLGSAAYDIDRIAHHGCGHIIQHDNVGSGLESLLDLIQTGGLDLYLDAGRHLSPDLFHCLGYRAGHLYVVVLDHGHIVQAHAVVGAAPVLYGHLVCHPHAWSSLACIQQTGMGSLQLRDIPGCLSGYARHPLEKVQGRTLSLQQGRITALHLQKHITFAHLVPVMHHRGEHYVLLKTSEHLLNHRKSGNHPVCLGRHRGHSRRRFGNNRVRGNVPRSDIFV